jgi:hypothetical protein
MFVGMNVVVDLACIKGLVMSEQPEPEYKENPVYDYGPEKPKRGMGKPKDDPDAADWPWKPKDHTAGGLILIGLGLYFLLSSLNVITGDFAWWALFIILPGVATILKAWSGYRRTGTFSKKARGKAFGGFMMVIVGSVFLFGLDWGKAWPAFLIVAGIALLFGWWD